MAGYLWRDRRRRVRRVVGLLIVAVAAVLVGTWPIDGGRRALHLLIGQRPETLAGGADEGASPVAEKELALRPLASPTASQPGETAVEAQPSTPPAQPITEEQAQIPTSEPALPVEIAGAMGRVVSPVTQPAPETEGVHTAARLFKEGLELRGRDRLIEGRTKLNQALHGGLTAAEVREARAALAELADRTVFSRGIEEGESLARWHLVTSGDTLGRIAKNANVSETLLARINGLKNKHFLREGTRLKVIEGPFHASIDKREHEMHLYLQNIYVKTLRVALGQNGGTPTGLWKVANHLENPSWIDPTGKEYHPDNPENPLGEYWIGLVGIDGAAVGQVGFGIHGTIEPETIGQDVSLGCVRLTPEDIALVYSLLEPGLSYVVIYE